MTPRRRVRIVCVPGLIVALGLFSVADADEAPEWIKRDKIRMGWGVYKLSDYEEMAAAGMNAIMPRLELDATIDYDSATAETPLSDKDAGTVDSLRHSSRSAKQTGLRYFHCLDIAASSQTVRVGFDGNPARCNDGATPSFVDPVYWRRGIVQRVQRAMDLLQGDDYAFDAVIIDPEMYALHGAVPGGVDYGSYAFNRFLTETKRQSPAGTEDPSQRKAWLETNGLSAEYEAWQYACVKTLAEELRDTVRARYPEAILGFIIYRDQMWFNAMAEGLYAPGHPVFVGPETTYSGVMDDSLVAYAERIRETVPVPILFVPGIRMGLENDAVPEQYLKVLPGNLYQRCQHGEGYWVWAIYRFGKGNQREAFFSPLRRVNAALDKQAETGVIDASLKAAPLPIDLPPDLAQRLANAATLTPVGPDVARPAHSMLKPRLRGRHTFILWPREGEDTTLTVRAAKLGNLLAPTTVNIFGPSGKSVWADTIATGDARVLRIPVEEDGPYAAVISAAMNAFVIEDASCPLMIWQGEEGVAVNSRGTGGRFFFLVPEGTETIRLTARGHEREYADFTVCDPTGNVAYQWKELRKADTQSIAVTKPGIWSITIDHMIDDASFALENLPNRFALRAEDVYQSKTE